jgi:hypothetical protein
MQLNEYHTYDEKLSLKTKDLQRFKVEITHYKMKFKLLEKH